MADSVILIVDDRPDNLFVLRELLGQYLPGSSVLGAANAQEALRLSLENRVDCALIDVQMPGTDGIELTRRLKSRAGASVFPIVLMTAHSTSANLRVEALEAGADDFISKPFNNSEFIARVKVMIRIKNAEDELRRMNAQLESIVEQRTKALEESHEMYRTLFGQRPILHYDGRSGRKRCGGQSAGARSLWFW